MALPEEFSGATLMVAVLSFIPVSFPVNETIIQFKLVNTIQVYIGKVDTPHSSIAFL